MTEYTQKMGLYRWSGADTLATTLDEMALSADKIDEILGKVTGADDVYFPFYTPQQMGATGTIDQDATPFIQEIIDKALTKGAVYCHIPEGTYRLTSRLFLTSSNIKIIADKGAKFIRDHSAGWFVNGRPGDMFTGYNGNGNITIEGGVWDGNLAAHYNTYNAVGMAHAKNIVFRDMEILDCRGAHAFDVNACKDGLWERCRFLGYDINYTTDGDGASYFREAIQFSAMNIDGYNYFGDWDGTPCENMTVRDCYFGASENNPAWPTGVGNHGHMVDVYNKNIRIYDNTFDGMLYSGLRPFKFQNTWIENNTFINCDYGVRFTQPDGNGKYDGGKSQSGKNLLIENNHFIGTKTRDIYSVSWVKDGVVEKAHNIQILSNIFEGSPNPLNNNIYLSFADNVLIRDNMTDGAYRFVMAYYCSNVRIKDNDLENIVTEVVYALDDVDYQGLGYTKDFFINGNTSNKVGRTNFLLGGVDGFEIYSNIITDATTETTNTRSAINASSGSKNGRIYQNKVKGANQKYGVEVTGTCSNVQTFNNDLEGVTGRLLNNSVGGFEGIYMHSANGTRYKMTVSDAGAPVFTAG